ncbi:MAG: hypothetical protein ACYC96_09520 [Fimbriimonadaceae bacterium]
MKYLVVALAAATVLGCKPSVEPPTPGKPPAFSAKKPGPPVGGAGIAPLGTPAVGGLTPVANSDSVAGAGMGGVGQAAKNQARKAAASTSQSQGE